MDEELPPVGPDASGRPSWAFAGDDAAAAITSFEDLSGGGGELGWGLHPLCPGGGEGREADGDDGGGGCFPPLLDVPESSSGSAAAAATEPMAASGDAASSVSSEEALREIEGKAVDDDTANKSSSSSSSGSSKKGTKRTQQPRFAFMTKSEIDHLEDGYRWRKYGQKAVKNSPFPRSYYRCTNSKCGVKKRVERSSSDPSVVITTYEGQHCHHTVSYPRGSSHLHAAAAAQRLPPLSPAAAPSQLLRVNPPALQHFAPLGNPNSLHAAANAASTAIDLRSPSLVLSSAAEAAVDEGLLGDIVLPPAMRKR